MVEEIKKSEETPVKEIEAKAEVVETVKEEEKVKEKKEKKVDSKPAVEKIAVDKNASSKKKAKGEGVVELEREYIVPMRKGTMNVPHYRRAKKAVKTLKEFLVKHMNVRDGDTRKVKVDIHLNNEIWFRGIKKPLHKVEVKAKKVDGIVYVTLKDPADYVKFKMAREEKNKLASSAPGKKKKVKKEEVVDADKDGIDDKKEEAEDKKAGAEKAAKTAKAEVKTERHTAQGKHAQKTAPVRKVLK